MEKVGIVGFGLIGQKRAESILKLGHLLDLVVDPISDSESINYKSINDVPEKALEDLDVLFICLPHHLIYETFKRVSQHVPKILIEKPLGLNLNEARKIKQLSRSNQNEICCGFNYRYLRHIEKLKNLIENNFFGKIFSISLSISHGGRPGMEEEWKIKKEYATLIFDDKTKAQLSKLCKGRAICFPHCLS